MSDHDQNGGGLPPESHRERRKRKALAQKMPKEKRGRQTVLEACHASREKQELLQKKVRVELYLGLQNIYTALCVAEFDPKLMNAVEKEAASRGIPRNAATCTALLFVRNFTSSHIEPATTWQQAMALRGATLKNIEPGKLAEHLKKEGIVKLAEYFRVKTKPKARTPDDSGTTVETTSPLDDVPANTSLSTEDRSDDGDTVDSGPALAWPVPPTTIPIRSMILGPSTRAASGCSGRSTTSTPRWNTPRPTPPIPN